LPASGWAWAVLRYGMKEMQQLRIALEQARHELARLGREFEGERNFRVKVESASEQLEEIIESLFGDEPAEERLEPLEGVPTPAPGN
jgi:hypothetical protein